MSDIKNYDKAFEDLMISILISNPSILARSLGILRPAYFDDNKNQDTVKFIIDYAKEHQGVPTPEQIFVTTKSRVELNEEVALKHDTWALKELESFCRYKALRDAILASPDLLEEGRYGDVEKMVKDAVQIALVKDLGTAYYANPKERLQALLEDKGQTSIGWKSIDEKLYGGLNRGEITIFAGQSGAGKSLFLQNIGVNWAKAGLNVVYISLELSEKLCAMRIDAMHTGYGTREVLKNIDNVHMKLVESQRRSKGTLQIKQMPNGCTSHDLRAYIKELEIHSKIKVDAILVDYLDLMMPNGKKISAENLFVKDKYITEELRNLAVELDILCVTASQLNRSSYDETNYDASNISGGISKINTADNVIGIFTSGAMKEAGRYQIQFMKTRSSSGVGSRLELSFDKGTLRIDDLEEGDEDVQTAVTAKVLQGIRNKQTAERSPTTSAAFAKAKTIDTKAPPSDSMQGIAALRNLVNRNKKT